MAVTLSNIRRGNTGDMYSYSGTFTSAAGDTTVTITHGMNYIAVEKVDLQGGAIESPQPKITNSAGVATVTFTDTMGCSGNFYFVGK